MYVCILDQYGEIKLHRHLPAHPEAFLKAITPYRDDMVVAVEGLVTWFWLADLCAREGLPFVLGHALSMQALHGGTATHDTIDAQKMAVLLRGGRRPQTSVDPAAMRATRDLLRRRLPRMRQRAERLPHGQQTNSQYNLPAIGTKIADQANRHGVADRFPDPAVHKRIEVDLALINSYDRLRTDLELSMLKAARPHHANTRYRLQTGPGIGKLLGLVVRYDIHAIHRVPRVQDVVSYCRLVTWAQESAGKRDGTSGKQMGHASLPWAFSAAAVLFLRQHAAAQQLLARLEKKHGNGQAVAV